MGLLIKELRDAAKATQLPQKEIARAAMIDPANISRFMNGQGALSLDAAERLAFALGLTLVPDSRAERCPVAKRCRMGQLYDVRKYIHYCDYLAEMTEHEREAFYRGDLEPDVKMEI